MASDVEVLRGLLKFAEVVADAASLMEGETCTADVERALSAALSAMERVEALEKAFAASHGALETVMWRRDEDPATVALRADLAKAREEAGAVAAQHHRRERDLEHERNLAQMRSRELESSLAKAKERLVNAAEVAMGECIKIWGDAYRARQVFDAIMDSDVGPRS